MLEAVGCSGETRGNGEKKARWHGPGCVRRMTGTARGQNKVGLARMKSEMQANSGVAKAESAENEIQGQACMCKRRVRDVACPSLFIEPALSPRT